MDDCSWLLFQGHGIGTDSEGSDGSAGLHEEQDVAISLQIYMMMDTEEHGYAEAVTTSSSSTFPSLSSSGSADENSSFMLTGSTTTTTASFHHPVDVSSLQILPSPIAYNDDHHGLFFDNLDTIVNLDDLMAQEPHQEQGKRKNGFQSGGAFKPYVDHLMPRKKTKPGACGQRAFKSAMSALERMHMARLAKWQSYQMGMSAPPPSVDSSGDQLQHVLSERKRREKLNDSFKALRTVLPPGSKKDRASTLIRARDYVNSLKSRVSELEEKNKILVDTQLHGDNAGQQDDYSGEQVEVDISRPVSEETSQEFKMKVVVKSGCNAMDALVTILQSLKEIEDVRFVAMDTGSSTGHPLGKDFQTATITVQVKSSRYDDKFLKESLIRIVKDAMKSEIVTS
ncbi:hypothetical protein EJB05_33076, partial [Eragrostis curvula]